MSPSSSLCLVNNIHEVETLEVVGRHVYHSLLLCHFQNRALTKWLTARSVKKRWMACSHALFANPDSHLTGRPTSARSVCLSLSYLYLHLCLSMFPIHTSVSLVSHLSVCLSVSQLVCSVSVHLCLPFGITQLATSKYCCCSSVSTYKVVIFACQASEPFSFLAFQLKSHPHLK